MSAAPSHSTFFRYRPDTFGRLSGMPVGTVTSVTAEADYATARNSPLSDAIPPSCSATIKVRIQREKGRSARADEFA